MTAKPVIRFTLNPDVAPPGSLLHGWSPEFEIVGNINEERDEFRRWWDCEIVDVRHTPRTSSSVYCNFYFRKILESNLALRHEIEELLLAAASEQQKGDLR
jgi:hypothetical protein